VRMDKWVRGLGRRESVREEGKTVRRFEQCAHRDRLVQTDVLR